METSSLAAPINGEEGAPGCKKPRTSVEEPSSTEQLTSRDYYFDSYSHFGSTLCLVVAFVAHCP